MSAIEPAQPREPRVPVPPNMALRVAILSGLAMAMFGIIFFRLWFLQVLSGEQYVQQANANRVRELPIAAPRGDILDREGQPIVSSRTTNAVEIVPQDLPDAGAVAEQAEAYKKASEVADEELRAAGAALAAYEATHHAQHPTSAEQAELSRLKAADRLPAVALPPLPGRARAVRSVFARLGAVLGLRGRTIDERVLRGVTSTAYAPVTIKTDAGRGVLTYLGEREDEFPGVLQEPVTIRDYKYGSLAAQVIGYVDQISTTEQGQKAFKGVLAGTVVGQEGLEYYYDRYLRGTPGTKRIEVNASGQPVAELKPIQPQSGRSLRVTLSLPLQKEGEAALLEGIERARAGQKPATGGAFVAMDPRNGEILAMGSWPTFDPNDFARPLTENEFLELEGSGEVGGKLTDRAVNGAYPTGSTFKPITAMAALEGGILNPEEGLGAGSCIYVSTEKFCNAGDEDFGDVGLVDALKVSSDTYFFEVGKRANAYGDLIQNMARKLGVGEETGIDLPSEFEGVLPDKHWREVENAKELRCEREEHKPACGIVLEPTGTWTVGDNMHLAVGQGELLTNPLQMAVAYSTLANAYMNDGNGHVVTPHLGMGIDEDDGGLIQSLSFPARRQVHLNPTYVDLVMEGIHDAASESGGTSADVWAGWNQEEHPVYGKTGTAEHYNQEDQSWYMCYVADEHRPIVIAVTVEKGGFGAETAAPIARLIASEWFHKPLKFVAGTSKTL
jgi:penicillin-binding protein 2